LDDHYARAHPEVVAGRYAVISVTDTGLGMTEEVRSHIFEPFYTTKELGKGTGLGLSTVFGIVKQHGGHITCYSELGRGTVFKIYLPWAVGEAQPIAEADGDEQLPRGDETVLVVEDEADVRIFAVRALRELGYQVLEAGHGDAGLRMAVQYDGPIDLVISDVVMPQMGGVRLAEQLRSARPETAILLISGYSKDFAAPDGAPAEGLHFLQKPFTVEALAQRVREIMDTRSA